jgi:hypothetical protein
MTKRWFILEFFTQNGVWTAMPETDEACVVAALVDALLRFRRTPGEFIRVSIREDFRPD